MSFHHNKHVYTLVPMALVGFSLPIMSLFKHCTFLQCMQCPLSEHTSCVFHRIIVESNHIQYLYVCVHTITCACVHVYVSSIQHYM